MMDIPIAGEVVPFLVGSLAVFGLLGLGCRLVGRRKTAFLCYLLAVVSACYMLYFFRDPERSLPDDPYAVVAGADGIVMAIKDVQENQFLNAESVRISIFLSLFDVHVNRSPIAGKVTRLGYYPGKRFFTFQEKSSECNQHSSILIEGPQTRCLVNQIVGPVARRVVYWLRLDQQVAAGERIGMMKFGSRLDMYLPKSDVTVLVQKGDRVKAGVTVVGRIRNQKSPPRAACPSDLPGRHEPGSGTGGSARDPPAAEEVSRVCARSVASAASLDCTRKRLARGAASGRLDRQPAGDVRIGNQNEETGKII